MTNNVCAELNNIKYKTMLMKGLTITQNNELLSNIDDILEKESNLNKQEPWSKLDKTIKLTKLTAYSNELIEKYKLNSNEIEELKKYFSQCLDKKNLQRVKDVLYDKENGIIKNIPCLTFNNTTRKFFLKKNDKHISTVKSLGPKKKKVLKDFPKLEISD